MAPSKILIIDDDPDITEAMRVVLENEGYEVDNAIDGANGMRRIKAARPDLIILDVMMTTAEEGFENLLQSTSLVQRAFWLVKLRWVAIATLGWQLLSQAI
jgi:DNA-binding response OmpR family regulator